MIYFIISSLSTILIIKNHKHIAHFIKHYFKKWRQVNSMVSITHSNSIIINIISLWTILKYISYRCCQKHHSYFCKIKKINHRNYELTYNINQTNYKINLYHQKGPMNIIKVENSLQQDVTDIIISYYGIGRDFHGASYKPTDFGFKSLKFYFMDDKIIQFHENEIIQI